MKVMDRVGGYGSYRALLEDARAHEDVLLALMGEADAARILQAQQGQGK